MKIVDVSAFYTPYGGGVHTYVERKIRYAARAGLDLVLVVPGAEDGEQRFAGGARMISVASPKLIFDGRYRYFRDAQSVHAILDQEQPDIVEASSPWRTANIVASWSGRAVKSLVMHADPMATYAYRWFGDVAPRPVIDKGFAYFWRHLRRAAAAFDMVICANPDLTARLRHQGITNGETVPLGIESGRFDPTLRSTDLRERLLAHCHLPPDARLFLGVGRLSAEKRWPMIIDALTNASARHPAGLVIIGEGRDRPALAKAIAGNPHIWLAGQIADRPLLSAMMASADALVHGCDCETFGLVVAEAAASGLPLILPDTGGAVGFSDPLCGETYRAGNAASLARALDRFLMRDHAALLTHAAQRATKVFSINDHFDALLMVYGRALLGAKAA